MTPLIAALGEPVVTVGLHQRVDASHAPHPSNDSERLVFRQLYETLVSVDCMGRPEAGLASSCGGSTPTAGRGSSRCGRTRVSPTARR